MAGSVNKVILVGHLGRDPETRSLNNGDKVVNLRVATSESWRDKQSGERREKSEWHNVVIWNEGLAGVAERYLRKGSKVFLEGQLQTRKWTDKDGAERYSTEVVLARFRGELVLLDKGDGSSRGGGNDQGGDQGDGGFGRPPANRGGAGAGRPFDDDLDDDVPF